MFSFSERANPGTGIELGCCLIDRETGKIKFSDRRFDEWTKSVLGLSTLTEIASFLPEFQTSEFFGKGQHCFKEVVVAGPLITKLSVQLEAVELEGDGNRVTLLRFYSEHPRKDIGNHDSLTGLPDRSALTEYVEHLTSRIPFVPYVLLFLDLDQFKQINDEHGHRAGDLVLIEVVRRWKEALRSEDFACRYGGDEFVIVLSGINQRENVSQIVDRLKASTAEPVVLQKQQVSTTVSIGTVLADKPSVSLNELIDTADRAMYERKRSSP